MAKAKKRTAKQRIVSVKDLEIASKSLKEAISAAAAGKGPRPPRVIGTPKPKRR